MKISKIAALAIGLFTACAGPASAATLDYSLSIPLVTLDAAAPMPAGVLTGTLSYDEEAMSGTFSLTDAGHVVTNTFAGFAFLLPADDAMGVLFQGSAEDGTELYFNLLTGPVANDLVSDRVSFCLVGCNIFGSIGAVMTPAQLSATVPADPVLPGATVSPVPLPPASLLFGGALLALGGFGAVRRRALASVIPATTGIRLLRTTEHRLLGAFRR